MGKRYEKKEIIRDFESGEFEVLNYSSRTSDTDELCTEVLAEHILQNLSALNEKTITREGSYKVDSEHHKKGKAVPTSNRKEEILAIKLFNKLDTVIDHQVPLKNEQKDDVGKIDLLYEDGNNLFICELKAKDSKETLLRAVVQIYQYSMILDVNKFKKDFGKENFNVKCAVLLVKGSDLHDEYKRKEPNITALIKKLDIEFFLVDDEKFEIKKA